MSNATVNELGKLHGIIAKALADQIKNGTKVENKDGKLETIPAPASVLNVARQFLRDNNIECSGAHNEDVVALTESLPFDEQPKDQSTRPN
jgi:hypothetical protein